MSAMRALSRFKPRGVLAYLLSLVLSIAVLIPIEATALSFNSAPVKFWGYIYASDVSTNSLYSKTQQNNLEGEVKSEWRVTYNDFPTEARDAVQYAIDIWSRNFESKVPISVDASWETNSDNRVLGSARPGYYFNNFAGAPDPDLWYPSALANSLAERDLDPRQKEIFLTVNSTPLWYAGIDGKPSPRSY
ncbi:MAG: fibronectin, partial [Actinomycetota bacterium]